MRKTISLVLACLLMTSCIYTEEHQMQLDELSVHADDLNFEADDIEEDFYITYSALVKVDSLLMDDDIAASKEIIHKAIQDVGEERFVCDSLFALDILTLRTVYVDSSFIKFRREIRFTEYDAKQETYKQTQNSKPKEAM